MLYLKYSMPPVMLGTVLALVLLMMSCSEQVSTPEVIETVDVGAGLEIDTSNDREAKDLETGLVGILPQDFPSDLPLYVPASLTDFGRSSAGRPTVTLLTSHEISRVRREIYRLLRQNGWDASSESDSRVVLKKNHRRAWLHLEENRPGTLYRFEY